MQSFCSDADSDAAGLGVPQALVVVLCAGAVNVFFTRGLDKFLSLAYILLIHELLHETPYVFLLFTAPVGLTPPNGSLSLY